MGGARRPGEARSLTERPMGPGTGPTRTVSTNPNTGARMRTTYAPAARTGDLDAGVGGTAASEYLASGAGGAAGGTPLSPREDFLAQVMALTGPGWIAYYDDQGQVRAYNQETEEELGPFFPDESGSPILSTGKGGAGGSGGGGGGDAVGWANLAQRQAEFERQFAEDTRRYDQDFTEGKRQFDQTFDRRAFENDRDYAEAREQFGKTFAEEQRQFNQTFGEDQRQFDSRMGEDQYQFDTSEGRMRASDEFNAGATRARLALDQARPRMDAESMALEAAMGDRGMSLNESQFAAETLRNPSDWFARAYASRGATGPGGTVTQADLLNTLGLNSNAARMAAQQAVDNSRRMAAEAVSVGLPTYQRPTATTRMAPTAGAPAPVASAAPAPNPYDEINALAAAQNAVGANVAGFNVGANAAPGAQPLDTPPRMQHGGATQSNAIVTGDSSDGKENEELVIDLPNDGGLLVIPKSRLIGKRKRMAESAPHAAEGGVFTTTPGDQIAADLSARGFTDEWANKGAQLSPGALADALGGYGTRGFTDADNYLMTGEQRYAPRMAAPPTGPADMGEPTAMPGRGGLLSGNVSQADLVASARSLAPPAIKAVASGARMPAFRQALANMTPGRVARMTGSEQQALNSYLGLTENTTLADELDGMRATFGPSVTRARARLVG